MRSRGYVTTQLLSNLSLHFSALQDHYFHLISWNNKYDERYYKFCNIKESFAFFLNAIKIFQRLGYAKYRRWKEFEYTAKWSRMRSTSYVIKHLS